jgi:Flp pilus assembly CpaE family ATPase
MTLQSGVLLVTKEPRTENLVLSALQKGQNLQLAGVCRALQELPERLDQAPAVLALVDIDPRPGEVLKELDGIATRFRETRFVVLSSELRNDLVLEAMQAGARHFILKDSMASGLLDVLERLAPGPAAPRQAQGSLITILSASGGCGATTIAINLASELQLSNGEPALVVDLDSSYGAVAAYLDVKGRYGIADLLASPGRIDAELVRSTALSYSEKLRVLLSPASIHLASPPPMDYALLDDAMKACKSAYHHTVVDAPRVPLDVAAVLAKASKITLMVLQLTVKDLRMAKAMWAALSEREVPRGKVMALVNRFRKRRALVTLEKRARPFRTSPWRPCATIFVAASSA